MHFALQVYFSSLTGPRCQVTSSSNQTPSIVESLICESIPSTPEIQQEGQTPIFPTRSSPKTDQEEAPSICRDPSRRLSSDSGACELEGPNHCDEEEQANNSNDVQSETLLKNDSKKSPNLQLDCNLGGCDDETIPSSQ